MMGFLEDRGQGLCRLPGEEIIHTPASTWMHPAGIVLREVSQTERQAACDLTYTWNLKHTANWHT